MSLGGRQSLVLPNGMTSRPSLGALRKPSLGQTSTTTTSSSALQQKPRQSLGARVSNVQRNSSTGSAGNRKLSTAGSTRPTTIKQDPRINDRNGNIRRLVEFLINHGFPQIITPKQLVSPSAKDFYNIVEFLFKMVDPTFHPSLKPEEDVLMIFKILKYPFPIPKRSLASVGTPHTWPALLAALAWFVELLEYDTELRTKSTGEDEMLIGMDEAERLFFNYLQRAYGSFMSGADVFTALEAELSTLLETKNQALKAEIEDISVTHDSVLKQITQYQSSNSKIQDLEFKKEVFLNDVIKFRKLNESLEAYKVGLQLKIEELQKEIENQNDELSVVQREKNQFGNIIQNQVLNEIDVEQINKEKKVLEEEIANASTTKEELKRDIWDMEMKFSKKQAEVDKKVQYYSSLAHKLKLLPPNVKNANNINYQIAIQSKSLVLTPSSTNCQPRGESPLSVDVKKTIKPGLTALKQSFYNKIQQTQETLTVLKDQLQKLEDTLVDRKDELHDIETKIKKLEAVHTRDRESFSSELKKLETEIESETTASTKLRQMGSNMIENSSSKSSMLNMEFENEKVRLENEKEKIIESILLGLDALTKHKEYITQQMQTLTHHFEEKRVEAELSEI